MIVKVHFPLFLLAAVCLAEPPGNTAKSPELHPDRRITFRLEAPKASEVKLWGEWITRFNTTELLKKDEAGTWAVTVGPLSPGKYLYIFLVDGLAVLDPNNTSVAVGREGAEGNLIGVTGETPMPGDERNVPHGIVHSHWYHSSAGLGQRRFTVYTPPGYAASGGTRYPVLLLLHGSGSTEGGWTSLGYANFIADDLIAQRRVRPMLIVMPNGHSSAARDNTSPENNADRVEQDLLRDVIPLVESLYRVERTPGHRAIAGASMGGFQALAYGLRHPERFGSIGVFSAGAHGAEGSKQVVDAVATGKLTRTSLFWIGIGDKDPLLKDAQALVGVLLQHKIKHHYVIAPDQGHTWVFWRWSLASFLPHLFRDQTK